LFIEEKKGKTEKTYTTTADNEEDAREILIQDFLNEKENKI